VSDGEFLLIDEGDETLILDEARDEVVVLPDVEDAILLIGNGEQGPPGPPGPPGTGGISDYLHTQASAALMWTVAHNLGRKPLVAVTSPGGVEVLGGEIVHLSDNTLQIIFDDLYAGQARCL
jgi:hypothetical protein